MTTEDFIIERTFSAPLDLVWMAISDREHICEWYFDLAEFKAEKGFRFQFGGCAKDGTEYLHLCEVTEVIPKQKLTYTWTYEGYEGVSHVSFVLREEAGKTVLTLTHSGLHSFPQSNPDFARTNFIAGWTDIIGTNLPAYLEKKQKSE